MPKRIAYHQPNLFAAADNPTDAKALRDPSFAENKTLPIHRWVPWIAGYSASFVDDVLDVYGSNGKKRKSPPTVLDPFAGVGTTLVQAMLRGCRTVGFEINPYAALAAQVKTRILQVDGSLLAKWIRKFELRIGNANGKPNSSDSSPPNGFKSRLPFFSPMVQSQVLAVLDFIATIKCIELREMFLIAFGSVMVEFSNYTYEPSLSTRPGAGKPLIENADVGAIVANKLRQMQEDVEWAHCQPNNHWSDASHRVVHGSFLQEPGRQLERASIDVMITSPPYMNNYHYVRNTRPQLYWLSLVDSSLATKQLEQDSFGKFWQTVRAADVVEPKFENGELLKKIEQLRNIRTDKGVYGGRGWANYVVTYCNDTLDFLRILKRALKRRGVAVVVVGNSIIQGIEFKVDVIFAEFAKSLGYIVEHIHLLRDKRVGASITQSSVRRGQKNKAALYESAVVLRKP